MSESDLLKADYEDVETVRQMYFNRGTVIMELQEERDTLIACLRECVVALGGLVSGFTVNDLHDLELMNNGRSAGEMSVGDVLVAEKAWTYAKSTLSNYER